MAENAEVSIVDQLRPREREVMRMRAKGMTQAEIARRLNLSYNTIRTYSRRACKRTNRTSIEVAVAVALAEAGK